MSAYHYEYQFYFSEQTHYRKLKNKISIISTPDDLLELLDLKRCLNIEKEHLDKFTLKAKYIYLAFTTSLSVKLNKKLIRAFKKFGCEYSLVKVLNDKTGEHYKRHLLQGQPVSGPQLETLLDQYETHHKVKQILLDNDTQALAACLKYGLDANLTIDGDPLLKVAIDLGKLEVFHVLLKQGADVNAVDDSGISILMNLLLDSDEDKSPFIIELIKNGVDINQCDQEGASVLWLLAPLNRALSIGLIKKGAEFKRPGNAYKDKEPIACLATAMQHNDLEMIKKYFFIAAKDHALWPEIASESCEYDQYVCLDALLKHGFSAFPEEDGKISQALLVIAADEGSLNCFSHLYTMAKKQKIDISESVGFIIDSLAARRHAEKILEEVLADHPGLATEHTLSNALKKQAISNMEVVLASGLSLDAGINFTDEERKGGDGFLHDHLHALNADSARLLLYFGCDPMAKNSAGETVVSRALSESGVKQEVITLFSGIAQNLPVEQRIWLYLPCDDLHEFILAWKALANKELRDGKGDSLLAVACKKGHAKVVRFLLTQGTSLVEKNRGGNTPLAFAVINENLNCVKLLLEAGADANDQVAIAGAGSCCLLFAASTGNNALIQLLIKYRADLSAKDNQGKTALFYTVLYNHSKSFELLLAAGADKDVTNKNGESLLYKAAFKGLAGCCKRLIGLGLDVNQASSVNKQTPIVAAACSGKEHAVDVCRVLLEAGADIDAVNGRGVSALISACKTGNQPLIKMLLEEGANTDIVDKSAQSAYDHFVTLEIDTKGFDLQQLEPRISTFRIKKALINTGNLICRKLLPMAVVIGLVGYFNVMYGVYLAAFYLGCWGVWQVWNNKKRLFKAKKVTKPKSLDIATTVIGRAMEEHQAEEKRHKLVIDSWHNDLVKSSNIKPAALQGKQA